MLRLALFFILSFSCTAAVFKEDILPVLTQSCLKCHEADNIKGGYRVDTIEQLFKPGKSKNTPIVAGAPDKSKLYHLLVAADEEDRMPQKAPPLSKEIVEKFRNWIEEGAKTDGLSKTESLASLARPKHPAPPISYKPLPVYAIAWMDEKLAVSGYHEVLVFDAAGKLLERIQSLPERIQALDYSKNGLLIAGGTPGRYGEVTLWRSNKLEVIASSGDMVLAIKWSGDLFTYSGVDPAIVVSGPPPRKLTHHADCVFSMAVRGNELATASRDRTVRVSNLTNGVLEATMAGSTVPITAVAWSEDGKRLFSAGKEKRIRIWRYPEGNQAGELSVNGEILVMIGGRDELLSAGVEGIIYQHNTNNRQVTRTYKGHKDYVFSLALSPDKKHLASGSYDGEVIVWDLEGGGINHRFMAAPPHP